MKYSDFERITSQYYGTLVKLDDRIRFYNDNVLNNKRVKCEIELTQYGCLNGEEETCKIIGGFGYPSATEEILVRELERYHFKKKEFVQMSLF